jgi:hypothetical protein
LSLASRWIHKKKCYAMNIFTAAVLRGVWLTRNNRGLVRCEECSEKNFAVDPRM